MFICFGESKSTGGFFDSLPFCEVHDSPIKFICRDAPCRSSALLCAQCLSDHKDHRWENLQQFFTPEVKKMLETGNSKTTVRIHQANELIVNLFDSFRRRVAEQISRLEGKISSKLEKIHENNMIEMRGGQKLCQESVAELLQALQKERSVEWVQNLKTFLESAVEQAIITIDTIMDDLEEAMGTQWQDRTHLQNELALKELKQHLHYHKEKDPNYFKWNPHMKHPGITLSEDLLQTTFKKNLPSRPVAIAANPINQKLNKFAFQVIKLDKTAFIFAATTVFIGVCNPTTVKSVGMRRISQVGKGAYMIGSSGWSYHHKNPKYDRKNIVGFEFGEGEKVFVEIDIGQGLIIFSKKGKIFNSKFTMPLDLTDKEILQLKPCVSFDGDEGAIIRILNI